jgi:early secretory antigenic target protein ESAT-6
MPEVVVQTEDIEDKAGRVRAAVTEIEGQLTALGSAMAALAETWRGPAAANFQGTYADWHNTANQINTALTDIATSLGQTGQAYQETETSLSAAWQR